MHSGSFMYQYVLVPLGLFGTFSVCLAFVFLLPGVGNALAVIWTLAVGDQMLQARKAQKDGGA